MKIMHGPAIVAAVAAFAATRSGAGSADFPADLAIRETAQGLQLFVAAAGRGTPLLFANVPADALRERRTIPITALSPATPCGLYEQPVAVTTRDSRLIVVQAEPLPTVHECDLENGLSRVLYRGEPLRRPTGVAIAADGTVAVLDRGLRAVAAISRDQKVTVVSAGESPSLLHADDLGQLYAVDAEARGIIPVRLGTSDQRTPTGRGSWGGTFLALPAEPSAFAVYRDVFYVADVSGPTRAMLTAGRLSLEIANIRPRQAAMAASRQFLATLDNEASSVDVLARPIPASVVLDPTRGNPNESWLTLLEYLAARQLLARDRVPVAIKDETYDDVLRSNGVLLKVDRHPESVALPAGRTKTLFCALNPNICEAGYTPGLPYVVIPRSAPVPVLETETKALGGKDVKTWLDERVLLAVHQKEVSDVYLATRNPDVARSLETEMSRRQMVLATPFSPDLGAGTIIRIADGREEVVQRLAGDCGLEATVGKTSLIYDFTAPRAALPPLSGSSLATPRVHMSVGSWTRSSVSLSSLQKCRPPDGPPDRYLITEALAASDIRLTSTDGLHPEAALTVGGPFYVGYKVVPLAALSAGVTVPIMDPSRLKPLPSSAPSELLSLRTGSLTLPMTRWRVDVLVPSADSYIPGSALGVLLKGNPSVDVSPRERLDRSASSTSVAVTAWAGDLPATLEKARGDLASVIRYDEALAAASGSEDVYVGVVESSNSVNLDHPGFSADGQSAWYDLVGGSVLQPHLPADPPPAPSLTLQRADRDTEHGTHVAGIIAARRPPSLTLGLLPKTRLYLVPGNSTGDLKENIQKARDQQVYIFNMSQGFDEGTKNATLEELDQQMQENRWRDALFVVAAGNDGADFNIRTPPRPVLWAGSLPNVLTVGASDEKGENVLGQHQDGPDPSEPGGSNFGSRYVDLLAPGRMIHSLGKSGYAYACGSSQATPQVTAAAAMLFSLFSRPEIIRARLIYTADWRKPNFDKKVWGGLLNVHRAIFEPNKNVFVRPDKTEWEEIRVAGGATVRIRGDLKRRDGSSSTFSDDTFPFSRVLRMISLGGAKYRIALLSRPDDVLEFVEGTVTGSVRCTRVRKWDKNTQTFSLAPDVPVDCNAGISIGQFQDYVAARPASVQFK